MSEPIAERPDMQGYGVTDDPEGLLPWSWAEERLVANRNFWMVTASAAGRPHALPVWGYWRPEDHDFFFSCAPSARKARNLAANPSVTVATSDTVEVVSVEGRAEPVTRGPELEPIIDAFVAKYAGEMISAEDLAAFMRQPSTGWFHVTPNRAFGIIEEPDRFESAATRWRWPE